MRLLIVVSLCLATAALGKGKKGSAEGTIVLNGEKTEVRWSDGDSFKIKSGPHKGSGTRLQGYNTLEGYGPVHAWGEWTAKELYELALGSSQVAASKEWSCTTDGKLDGYKRLLIDCPEASKEMVRQGHALAYAVEGMTPDPQLLKLQKEAQTKKVGMWAKGVVNGVITSLHSVGEEGEDPQKGSYNRVVDTRTGEALVRKHNQTYATCQTVCEETDGNKSCMVYVPFKQRYARKPDCLK